MPHVPALRHPGGVAHRERLRRVVIDVEVLRVHRAEIEVMVVDLVLAEVLRIGARRPKSHHQTAGARQKRPDYPTNSRGSPSQHVPILVRTSGPRPRTSPNCVALSVPERFKVYDRNQPTGGRRGNQPPPRRRQLRQWGQESFRSLESWVRNVSRAGFGTEVSGTTVSGGTVSGGTVGALTV